VIGLDWPDGFERTPSGERTRTSKFSAGSRQTRKEIGREMDRIDADQWALDEANGSNDEPGVVLRWVRQGRDYAVACDRYGTKKANLRSVYLYVQETRKRNDRPVVTGAGDGFAAAQLPSGDGDDGGTETLAPHEVLGVAPDAPDTVVQAAARSLKKEHHPDAGGDEQRFKRVVSAEEAMLDGGGE